ncbi:nucleotidyl transferase AbiEii/AbiGii toxin family protein [Deinococcus detaillensis]|uniref:Nucleotidyl transferase AbiEii/AbiGii toxin family protein n=1 Tax=Deinococcus detaillensis TaxID=2592048 RepID=A0A553UF05_9DEIO|nr:nucleotidyl transferase AbiEii/AbiGii toxin family protein [Deinococcus detaillensis]TSA78778.1 nucleotidyl transferase AbiEii/AbiGii toxin family protein [Deinococcus detaillensis]
MPDPAAKNPVASIIARLKNEGAALGLTPEQLRVMPLQMAYAHQGFLARLDASRHAERFVVKGGASLFARYRALGRPTRDLDLASAGPAASLEEIRGWVEEICDQPFGDHLTFPTDQVQVKVLTPDSAAHPVTAVRLTAYLGGSRQIVDLDLSFGSVIHPGVCLMTYPRLVIPQAVRMRVYPLEQIIAEKFAAMVELNVANTRMKDFHDLWQIARHDPPSPLPGEGARDMSAHDLSEAMRRSFEARCTPLADLSLVLSPAFGQDTELVGQWSRYCRKANWTNLPGFEEIMGVIRAFPGKVAQNLPGRMAGRWAPDTLTWRPEEESCPDLEPFRQISKDGE